jgi:lysophospholipase L1-like esterase
MTVPTARRRRGGVLVAGLLAASIAPILTGGSPAAAAASTSKFTSITPTRVVDSRTGVNIAAKLGADEFRDIDLAGIDIAGQNDVIPSNATAVVATFTVTGSSGGGWMQVFPKGQRPTNDTSTLNTDGNGDVATTIFAPLNSGGITVRATFATQLLIDVSGYFTEATSSSAGRYVPVTPTRLYDSRTNAIAPDAGGAGGSGGASGGGKILFAGDSITLGTDASENFVSGTPAGTLTDDTFRRFLWQQLTSKCASLDFVGPTLTLFDLPETPYDQDHMATNGIKASQVVGDIAFWAPSRAADLVVVELGTNDAQFATVGLTPAQVADATIENYRQMVVQTRATAPNIKFLFVAPYDLDVVRAQASFGQNPRGDTNTTIAGIRSRMSAFVSSISGGGVAWVDAGSVIAAGTTTDSPDGVHPTLVGSSKLADLIRPQISSLLGCNESAVVGSGPGAAGTSGAKNDLRIDVSGRAGVPATGVSAVVIGLTATGAADAGWLQVGPAPLSIGAFSNINVGTGQTRANLAVVPLDSSGGIELYTAMSTDYLVDVMGYFTNESSANLTSGLFIPAIPPERHIDSRSLGLGQQATVTLPAGATGKSAVVLNVTSTANAKDTWLQVGPTPLSIGAHSNLNVPNDATDVAVGAISPIGAGNQIDVYYFGQSKFILDIMGYFS